LTYKQYAYIISITTIYYTVYGEKAINMSAETGFPSPAQGYEETTIDLNRLLVQNQAATFFMRMKGSRLVYRGIHADDLLVVDRSRPTLPGCLVVYRDEGEFSCRELVRDGDGYALSDGSGVFAPVTEETEIFGTVTAVVRKL
jgi:DNA polymerase V